MNAFTNRRASGSAVKADKNMSRMGPILLTVSCLVMTSHGALLPSSPYTIAFDTSVCSPLSAQVSEPPTPLVQNWITEITWSDLGSRRTYYVKDYYSLGVNKEAVVISSPYVAGDVRLLFDYFTQDITVEDDTTGPEPLCQVVHNRAGLTYSYNDLFYLTSFYLLFQQMAASEDAIKINKTTVRGIPATVWRACLFDYNTNMTNRATFYFSDTSWMSPFQTPLSSVPLRVEYFAHRHNGSQVTEYNIIGDLMVFQQNPAFEPEIFTTSTGVFCPNRTGESMRFPAFPDQFSLLMEVVDQDFTRITYQELWYDRNLKMVRWDSKIADGTDADTHSYIFDFNVGVKYMIDTHLMACEQPSSLAVGDDFVVLNQTTVSMMTPAGYFHSEAADIQYVGTATVRDVECNTWIGKYFDNDAEREVTVQWYFTTRQWREAAGSVEGPGAFFRMEVWKGGSPLPAIYNIMRYNPTALDMGVFDFSACYDASNKKHFTIEFKVVGPTGFPLLGRPYLKETVVQQLASRLEIQPNRFTDVTFDYDQQQTLFMTGTLLGPPAVNSFGGKAIDLTGAFDFLRGSIAVSHINLFLTDSDNEPIPLKGVNIVEHNYRFEFSTTTTTTAKPTSYLVPTLAPKTTSELTTPLRPTAPPSVNLRTTATTECSSPAPCICLTASRGSSTTSSTSTVSHTASISTARHTTSTALSSSKRTSHSMKTSSVHPSPSTRLAAQVICPLLSSPPSCNCSSITARVPTPTSPTNTTCPPPRTCPPAPPCICRQPTPCPPRDLVTCLPGSTPCTCPIIASTTLCPTPAAAAPCTPCPPCGTVTAGCTCPLSPSPTRRALCPSLSRLNSQNSSSCPAESIVGALSGGLVAALLVGLLAGFVMTRYYHVFRNQPKPFLSNIIENENF